MQSVDKKYFVYNKGINTEAPLVAWPEGFTVDEQNFDLMQDGSRRRRLGLSYEAGGTQSPITCGASSTDGTSGTRFYRWRNVDNNDERNFVVAQIGASIYVWDDPVSGPLGNWHSELPLTEYKVKTDSYEALDEDIATSVCSFAEADGKLIVVGPHTEPLQISWSESQLVGEPIKVLERDLFGVDDGVDVKVMPDTLTDTHKYNLYNRGWVNDNIDSVFAAEDKYPAKNMIQYLGLRTLTQSGYSDNDGVKLFSPDKLMKEIFQNMSAPQGHIVRNVFDRTEVYSNQIQGNFKVVGTIDNLEFSTGEITMTSKSAIHEVVVGNEISLKGTKCVFRVSGSSWFTTVIAIAGRYIVTEVVDANTFKFIIPTSLYEGTTSYVRVEKKGYYVVIPTIIPEGLEGYEPATTRFAVVAAFAGRLFYGGCPDTRLTDKIYYSRSIEAGKEFGICHQDADPTSEFISDLLPTDGGYITIPNLGTLRSILPYGRSLLVFSSEGVWAIGPGESGYFSALGYSVRKITDAGCIAKQSVVLGDNTPLYWANAGIYAIMEDSNSGFLSAQNITQSTINGLYHSIRYTEKTRVKAAYDSVRKRVLFLYNSRLTTPATGDAPLTGEADLYSTSLTPIGQIDDFFVEEVCFDTALILDLRLGAWTKWVFGRSGTKVRDIYTLPTGYGNDDLNAVIRFFSQEIGTQKYYMGQLTNSDYLDWGIEAPAFILTGPDSLGEPERFRYAPYVHVFMRKESKVPLVVDQDPDAFARATLGSNVDLTLSNRASSLFMQPRWDWARGLDSGKISSYTQVFRETKTHPDSFGMVVTKNKVRGRGRNLFLSFKAGVQAPAWLDGWTIKYDAQTRI